MLRPLIAALPALLLLASPALAATQTYQVTGPVVTVDDQHITVMKGTEKWQLARDASTKITGDVKPGSKVTIQYTMTATTVAVKDAPKAGK